MGRAAEKTLEQYYCKMSQYWSIFHHLNKLRCWNMLQYWIMFQL